MKNQFFTIMVCLLMCTLGVNGQKKQAAGVNFEKNYAEALAKVGKSKQKQDRVRILRLKKSCFEKIMTEKS